MEANLTPAKSNYRRWRIQLIRYEESIMKWLDLEHNSNRDDWTVKIEDVRPNHIDEIYLHELVDGSFIFANPHTQKVNVNLKSAAVKDFGAYRAWWTLREDVGVERFKLPDCFEEALWESINRPNPYRHELDDDSPAVGSVSW